MRAAGAGACVSCSWSSHSDTPVHSSTASPTRKTRAGSTVSAIMAAAAIAQIASRGRPPPALVPNEPGSRLCSPPTMRVAHASTSAVISSDAPAAHAASMTTRALSSATKSRAMRAASPRISSMFDASTTAATSAGCMRPPAGPHGSPVYTKRMHASNASGTTSRILNASPTRSAPRRLANIASKYGEAVASTHMCALNVAVGASAPGPKTRIATSVYR